MLRAHGIAEPPSVCAGMASNWARVHRRGCGSGFTLLQRFRRIFGLQKRARSLESGSGSVHGSGLPNGSPKPGSDPAGLGMGCVSATQVVPARQIARWSARERTGSCRSRGRAANTLLVIESEIVVRAHGIAESRSFSGRLTPDWARSHRRGCGSDITCLQRSRRMFGPQRLPGA